MAFRRTLPKPTRRHLWLGLLTLGLSLLAVLAAYAFLAGPATRAASEAEKQRAVIALAGTDEGTALRTAPATPAELPADTQETSDHAESATQPPPTEAQTPPVEAVPTQAGETAPPAEPVDPRSPSARIPPQAHPDITAEALPPIPAAEATPAALPEENPALLAETPTGKLPAIGENGLEPARYYAHPFTRPKETPLVAVLIPGLGQVSGVTEAALSLPPEVSISFSPYAREIMQWNRNARARGHETFLDLALPSADTNDAGPLVLTPEKWQERLAQSLAKLPAIVGLYARGDENFSIDPARASAVMAEAKARGLLMISGNADSGFGRRLAAGEGKGASADRAFPASLAGQDWAAAFAWAEARARERKTAILVLPPTPAAIEALGSWLGTLTAKGIALAPVTALVPEPRPVLPAAPRKEEGGERHNPALEDGKAEKKDTKPPAHHE